MKKSKFEVIVCLVTQKWKGAKNLYEEFAGSTQNHKK
jgi:hypothetical protein